jgi:hypothetical protein
MPKKSNEQLYEEAETELYGDAIRQTEQEVFDDALGLSPDENDGDTSLEQMDDDDAPTGDEEPTDDEEGEEPDESEEGEGEDGEAQGEEAPPPEGRDRTQDRRGIPPGRLREESDARRVAEAETRELRARLENLERNQRQPPQPQQQPERPDMFADPEGFERQLRADITADFAARHVNASLTDAREEHGEKFDQAYQDLIRAGQSGDRQTVQQVWDSPNPGRALMRWHNRQQVIRDVGTDPSAYRNKIAQDLMRDPEFRRQMVETLRDDAMNGDGGRPRTRTRLPASLNGASGGAGHRSRDPGPTRGGGFSASAERDIADSVWEN